MSATRKFDLIASDEVPEGALTWNGWKQRSELMTAWRAAVFAAFGGKAKCLRVAWVLSDLFKKHGYAYASDGYLSKEAHLPRNHLQEALTALHRGGAICRAHVPGKKTERRIFPSSKILASIPPDLGGIVTPRIGTKVPPKSGGQNYNKEKDAGFTPLRLPRNQLETAMRYAEARDRNHSISPDPDARGPRGPRREQHQQEEVQ